MQGAKPSEILDGLRNDGRSVHHLAEAHKAIDELEAKLNKMKIFAHEIHEKLEKGKE